jgi:putative transposase
VSWELINLQLFHWFIRREGVVYALIADEVVEGKAGHQTHGIRMFFSTTARRAIQAVNFFGFSLVDLSTGKTAPLALEQVVYTPTDEARVATEKAQKKAKKGQDKALPASQKGRPKGSVNKVKEDPATTKPVYRAFKACLSALITQINVLKIPLQYVLLDSAYASAHYLQLLQQYKLDIISKLPVNAALYFPYQGEPSKTKPKKYGDKVRFDALHHLPIVQTIYEDDIKYELFQYKAWHKISPNRLLNILTIRATHPDGKIKYAHLFTTDLTLHALHIKKHYQKRFQIEFDFRDVKQLFGLSKLKNYHATQLKNMFNMTFSALLFAKILQTQWAQKLTLPNLSLIDLKTIYKAQFYLKNAINNIPNLPQYFFSNDFVKDFTPNDIINNK